MTRLNAQSLIPVVSLTLALTPVFAAPKDFTGHQVVAVHLENRADVQKFSSLESADEDFDLWSEGVGVGIVLARVSPAQRALLHASGLRYEVVVDNLQTTIAPRRLGVGFYDDFRTYDEINSHMAALVAAFPQFASSVNIGTSIEGRPILGIRVTGSGTNKPGVLLHGCQHAREWLTPQTVLFVAEHLLSQYASDADVRRLVDNIEWYIIPVSNPDGYVYTWTTDRFWRKNRRGGYGVDLNRNWGYQWGGEGSSDVLTSDVYRGASAFSEPETQALRDFLLAHPNVRGHADIHTFGTLLLWPWSYTSALASDDSTFRDFAAVMRGLVFAVSGLQYTAGPAYTTLYPAAGASIDWVYGEAGRWSVTMELRGSGFAVPPDQIIVSAEENLPALLYFGSWIAACDPIGADLGYSQAGAFPDCDKNGTPDICEITNRTNLDCNGNLISDACDISGGASADCNSNLIPDECDPDEDCDQDGVRDLCGLVNTPELDCNGDWRMDRCESGDCNQNGVPDVCDVIAHGDCNHDGIPDDCQPDEDCNHNGLRDLCEIGDNPALDCNLNYRIDSCESGDCNHNSIPDVCDIVAHGDCNNNGIPDDCDAGTTSSDRNLDSVPDECQGSCCQCGVCEDLSPEECFVRFGVFAGPNVLCGEPGSCVSPLFAHDLCSQAYRIPSAPMFRIDFDNRCAQSEEPLYVNCPGSTFLGADLWYTFKAPCSGTVQFSMCQTTDFDAMIALYGGSNSTCLCPDQGTFAIACDDDGCGSQGGPPVLSRPVISGRCYTIRVGGWEGSIGTGDLTITYQTTCNPTDLNGSGKTDLRDFATFENCFGPLRIGCSASDFDHDGPITLEDYRALQAMMGQ